MAFMITAAWSVDRRPAAHAAWVASVWPDMTRDRATILAASPLLMPVRFDNHAVVEVAPSSLASPMSSAPPASRDNAASIDVRARTTATVTSRSSGPVNVHGSRRARSSASVDS